MQRASRMRDAHGIAGRRWCTPVARTLAALTLGAFSCALSAGLASARTPGDTAHAAEDPARAGHAAQASPTHAEVSRASGAAPTAAAAEHRASTHAAVASTMPAAAIDHAAMGHAAMGHPTTDRAPETAPGMAPSPASDAHGTSVHAPVPSTVRAAMSDHAAMGHGAKDHAAKDHAAMDHAPVVAPARTPPRTHAAHDVVTSSSDASAMAPAATAHRPMDHTAMDHGAMDHGAIDLGGHAMPPLSAGAGTAVPRTPIPALTDADRAAARPPAHAHAHGGGVFADLRVDRLEAWNRDRGGGQAWAAQAWLGNDRHRLWLRSEGEREHGRTAHADVELLYGRPIARWWDLLAGVRHEAGAGPRRTQAAIGVAGVAPYKFEVDATAYLDASGRAAARVEVEYEVLLTDRLVLQPVIEAQWHGQRDARRGVGAGLGTVEAGLRLRYGITRRIAPYVGVAHARSFGDTADLRGEAGEPARDTRIVAGLRLWF